MSYHSAPAQRVPAWKRLGLKLKGPASDESPTTTTTTTATTPAPSSFNGPARVNVGSPASALKRKPTSQQPLNTTTPSKKPRTDGQTPASRKSVAFAEGTKDVAPSPAAKDTKKATPKKKKTKKPAADAKADFNLEPSLLYLRQWHTARDSWKFNKNHQTLLIKYFFDAFKVPSADTPIFYQYIRDLKGFVRTRLRETAAEIKKQDMEGGSATFGANIKDKEDKQKTYDDLIVEFVRQKQAALNGNGKRSFDEVELAIRAADPKIKQRLLKRIRAEMVLEELSDSESTTSTDTTTTTSSSGTDTVAPAQPEPATRRTESQQPAKRRRLRNVRTEASDTDSSDSESESESSSSSDSSDDEDEDEDMEGVGNQEDSSSSSSSSSSSDSSSDSDGAEEEEGDSSESAESDSSEEEEDD